MRCDPHEGSITQSLEISRHGVDDKFDVTGVAIIGHIGEDDHQRLNMVLK